MEMNLSQIVERMMTVDVMRFGKQKTIAEALGMSATALNNRIKNNSVPRDKIEIWCNKESINVKWVLMGEGNMRGPAAEYPHGTDKFKQFSEQLPIAAGGAEPALLPNPDHMTLEQKLHWLGFKTKDIRQIQEWSKLSEEEQDEELKRLCMQNIEKGRF